MDVTVIQRSGSAVNSRFNLGRAAFLILLSIAFLAVGLALYVVHATKVNAVALQWAGSAKAATKLVHSAAARQRYREALDWDIWAFIPGYGAAVIVACFLGRKVFWRRPSQAAALVGVVGAATAAACNWGQDALLLVALSHRPRPMSGVWLFRSAAALSFVKFATLLMAAGIALIALATTASRIVLHRRTKDRWLHAEKKTENSEQAAASEQGEQRPTGEERAAKRFFFAMLVLAVSAVYLAFGRRGSKPSEEATGAGTQIARKLFVFAPLIRKLHEEAELHPGPDDPDLTPQVLWWDKAKQASVADPHWVEGSTYPFDIDQGKVGICVSGGGIRAATVTLGALQALSERTPEDGNRLSVLEQARYLVSVSGGGYTTSAYQLALHAAETGPLRGRPGEVFAPGSVEEDHLRRHSSYISDTLGQWLTALGVLFRCVASAIALIGLVVTVLGLAIGRLYREIPIITHHLTKLRPLFLIHATIKKGKIKPPAPAWPVIHWGVTLAVLAALMLTVLAYIARLSWPSRNSKGAKRTAMAGKYLLGLTGLLVAIGVAIPALIWLSGWLTWQIGFSRGTVITTGTLTGLLTYLGAVAATLWRKKTSLTKTGSGALGVFSKNPVGQVLPSSMVQMLLLWLCLLVIVLGAFLASGWVATSGLDGSWWALLPVGVLVFAAIFVEQSWLGLQPFYRRRLETAFAIPEAARDPHTAGQRQSAQLNPLSTCARQPRNGRFPEVIFAATANITGQDRTPPGRRAAPFMLGGGHVGGPQTGWISTAYLENLVHEPIRRDLDVTAARAISGAAFAAAMGGQTRFFEAFLALTNVRLGAWLPNPWFVALKRQHLDDWTIPSLPSRRRLILLAREIFGIHPSWARMLLCTDGGHYDNLGLIELLRLRCKFIYCFDASGGGAPLADTLAGILTVAREELGVDISFAQDEQPYLLAPGGGPTTAFPASSSLQSLNPRISQRAVITGTINYPGQHPDNTGKLVFAQAALTKDLPYQLIEYTQDDPSFPRDGTADQWFNCNQFDAYQQLGYHLGKQASAKMAA
jgi:lysophospholipase-like protein